MKNRDFETMEFTGEFFVPGKSGKRIEADHMERYRFACQFAARKDVLDIACGMGYSAPLFLGAGAIRYHGVDINAALIDYASHTYGSAQACYSRGDVRTFCDSKQYDLITCFETIEHISDHGAALVNLYSVLREGGCLLISSPNRPVTSPGAGSLRDKPANAFHVQEFTPHELARDLRSAGFVVQDADLFGQRQRSVYSNSIIQKCALWMRGDPDFVSSAKVSRVRKKIPRYFIIAATK